MRENVHRVRTLLDEVFGEENCVVTIVVKKKSATTPTDPINDHIIWYARDRSQLKVRNLFNERREPDEDTKFNTLISPEGEHARIARLADAEINEKLENGWRWARVNYPLVSQDRSERSKDFSFNAKYFECGANRHWTYDPDIGMERLAKSDRIFDGGGKSLGGVVYWDDWAYSSQSNLWTEFHGEKFPIYVVQTNPRIVERCILMTSDPGDLVLDPTCGSGTTAFVAEQWGRRWITLDTSRVALALARTRLMSAQYPFYFLMDSVDGRTKEQEVTERIQPDSPIRNDIRQGFVYARAPHVTLKSITDNAEIDVIWDNYQKLLEPLREKLNEVHGEDWEEWEIPRECDCDWSDEAKSVHSDWWEQRISRQKEIDHSISLKTESEILVDRPYEDTSKVRVAGPFTVESLSPHRVVPTDDEELIYLMDAAEGGREREDAPLTDFTQMVIDNLKLAGVHQAAKDDRITFTTIDGWPGSFIAAEGRFMEGETEKRAAIFIGPEFGTVTRADLTAAAREALDARFDALIACGFNFDAHTSELTKLGPLPILKAKMNPDLHMSEELKNTGAGNLFVVFGEPDIEWDFDDDGNIVVEVLGVDVFDPKTGEVRASGKDDIAAWFIDTDYNEESFFVRHAYFMGANDPYKSLKTSLKAEIDQEAWETLYRDKSRPFGRPSTGRFAVKVINHFGDEVMKVFGV